MVRDKVRESLEGHLRRAAEIVDEAGGERMSADQYLHFTRASTRATALALQRTRCRGLRTGRL